MRILIRAIAVLAAVSVAGTILFIAVFVAAGGFRGLTSSLLGVATLVGWLVTLVCGPIAAVQLWRLRRSGRTAGIVMFGYGLAYYILGLLWLRTADAAVPQIVAAAAVFGTPLAILLLPRAGAILSDGEKRA